MSTASEWIKEYVWPEIQAMMFNDAQFRLVLKARQLTDKLKGPTGKLIDDGYLTFQMVTIRRLIKATTCIHYPNLAKQIDQLSGSLSTCDHVCQQLNKHVAHTARENSRNWEEWKMDLKDLEKAHKSIFR